MSDVLLIIKINIVKIYLFYLFNFKVIFYYLYDEAWQSDVLLSYKPTVEGFNLN